ncbi:MAG: sulfatase [Alistipes sp.]
MAITKNKLPLLGLLLSACAPAAADHPNVIYVFPDQFRNSSLGFWNDAEYASQVAWRADPVQTPNLDRFAGEAVVLSEAVSNCPVSSPHRGMLLTGQYPERSGVTLNCMSERPESSLRADAECIGDVFSAAGYDCAYIGKLHVDAPTRNNPQRPGTYVSDDVPEWDAYTPPERRHGFNYWYSYGTYDVHKHPHYWDTAGERHEVNEWSVQHEIGKAIDYIRNVDDVRDGDKPFFMMIGLNPPHSPYASINDCDSAGYELYRDKSLTELLVRDNADTTMAKAAAARFYFANVSGIDREFGRLLRALDRAGLAKNTIVIFASDHGETMCSHSINDPKNSIYREAFNIPFMVRYPARLTHRVDSVLLSTPDIMPTVLGLAGLSERIPQSVEGRNLSSVLAADTAASVVRPRAALYLRNLNGERDAEGLVRGFFPAARGVKTADYTLELTIDRDHKLQRVLLFDDRQDPYQMHSLDPAQHAALFADLCGELAVLLRENNDIWYREQLLAQILPYDKCN